MLSNRYASRISNLRVELDLSEHPYNPMLGVGYGEPLRFLRITCTADGRSFQWVERLPMSDIASVYDVVFERAYDQIKEMLITGMTPDELRTARENDAARLAMLREAGYVSQLKSSGEDRDPSND